MFPVLRNGLTGIDIISEFSVQELPKLRKEPM
jgi:hypothetical protein